MPLTVGAGLGEGVDAGAGDMHVAHDDASGDHCRVEGAAQVRSDALAAEAASAEYAECDVLHVKLRGRGEAGMQGTGAQTSARFAARPFTSGACGGGTHTKLYNDNMRRHTSSA